MIGKEYKKIWFDISDLGWPSQTETLNAYKDGDNYVLDNTPFYARGFAFLDKVSVKEHEGKLYVDNVIERSGNSTIRVFFLENTPQEEMLKYLDFVLNKGCSFERAGERLFAINVPKDCNYSDIRNYLSELEKKNILEFEEGFIFVNK